MDAKEREAREAEIGREWAEVLGMKKDCESGSHGRRGEVVDVCLAGNPAINGQYIRRGPCAPQCGDVDCVCACQHRWMLTTGNKTDLGLYRTICRMVSDAALEIATKETRGKP